MFLFRLFVCFFLVSVCPRFCPRFSSSDTSKHSTLSSYQIAHVDLEMSEPEPGGDLNDQHKNDAVLRELLRAERAVRAAALARQRQIAS